MACKLCVALFVAIALTQCAADPSVARNDLLSSSARFGGQQPILRRRAHAPVDAVPAPAIKTTRAEEAAPQHMPIMGAIMRAVGVIALAILAQTLGEHSALPQWANALIEWLVNARTQWPLLVTTACAFCMYAASDVLSQCAAVAATQRETIRVDRERLLRTGCTAGFLSGFLAVFYFGFLERTWSGAPAWQALVGKISMDVGMYEPCYDVLYITLQALLRGESLDDAKREVSLKVLKVWAMAPRYWILADALNFGLMPLRLRPMMNALLSIPWAMYISAMANTHASEAPAPREDPEDAPREDEEPGCTGVDAPAETEEAPRVQRVERRERPTPPPSAAPAMMRHIGSGPGISGPMSLAMSARA